MSETERDFLEEEQVAQPEAVAPEVKPETVEEVPPETPAPEATTAKEPQHVPIAALLAERDKRQEERRLREQYERELAELRNQAQPNFYEQPEQYVHEVVGGVQRQLHMQMLSALEAQAREVYPDYDEVFQIVQENAQGNPVLTQQILQSPNPALAAYKLGKQLREMREMSDPAAYRAKIAAEERAKIEAEMQARTAARSAIPPDLTTARGAKGEIPPPPESAFDEVF